jgi:hypothetical protein
MPPSFTRPGAEYVRLPEQRGGVVPAAARGVRPQREPDVCVADDFQLRLELRLHISCTRCESVPVFSLRLLCAVHFTLQSFGVEPESVANVLSVQYPRAGCARVGGGERGEYG